jgi:hypothetical protein
MKSSFVKQDRISIALSGDLAKDNEKRSSENKGTVLKPSQITQCPRRMFYRSQGIEHECDNSFAEGCSLKALADKWIYMLGKCNSVNVVDEHIVVAHAKYNLSGSIDAYVEFDGYMFMVKVKPTDIDRVRLTGAKRKDVVEVVTYLWMTELKDALLIYEDINGSGYKIFHIEPYAPIINTVKSKCSSLINSQLSGVEPPRLKGVTETDEVSECKRCEHSYKCLNRKIT